MDEFPLSAKQQNSTYNHNIVPDTQIKALDKHACLFAITYKYVFVLSKSFTKDTCKQISDHLEKYCMFSEQEERDTPCATDAYHVLASGTSAHSLRHSALLLLCSIET